MGYSREALVILPKYEYLFDTEPIFQAKAKSKIKELFDDLKNHTIPFVFDTDDTANALTDFDFTRFRTLSMRDVFFISRNCEIPIKKGAYHQIMGINSLIEEAGKKYPHKEGASLDVQFEVVQKRDNYVRRNVIKNVGTIVYFKMGGYKLPRVPDSTLVIEVNKSFQRNAYIGGREVNLNKILR